ncbi:hypothetical protein I317_02703 [Kwoniella heveanensis CBS 569]|nr:hypothetical protein I317_02703 [Kwoniella heveanensis CBS 569]
MSGQLEGSGAPPLNAYALWLVPSLEEQSDRLQTLINELASLESASPTFEPHITLLHPIDLSVPLPEVHKTLRAAIDATSSKENGGLKDFTVQLTPAQSGSKYYQSVLAPVKPESKLLTLRKECEKAFRLKDLPEYFPHLSLLYGELSGRRRDEIADVANRQGELDKVEVDVVAIVRCVGTPEDWEVVGTEKLS